LEFWLSFIEKFFVSVFCAYPKLFGDSLNIGRMIQFQAHSYHKEYFMSVYDEHTEWTLLHFYSWPGKLFQPKCIKEVLGDIGLIISNKTFQDDSE